MNYAEHVSCFLKLQLVADLSDVETPVVARQNKAERVLVRTPCEICVGDSTAVLQLGSRLWCVLMLEAKRKCRVRGMLKSHAVFHVFQLGSTHISTTCYMGVGGVEVKGCQQTCIYKLAVGV